MAYVYILQSIKNQRYYIGSTDNISQRLLFHKSGKVKATKDIRPLKLVFKQEYETIKLARNIEARLKRLKRRDYIQKIISDGIIKISGG